MRYILIALVLLLGLWWMLQVEPNSPVGAPPAKAIATSTLISFLEAYSEEGKLSTLSYKAITSTTTNWKEDNRFKQYIIPDGFTTQTYDSPLGHGFCVRYEGYNEYRNWGFGPDPSVCGEALIIKHDSWIASST